MHPYNEHRKGYYYFVHLIEFDLIIISNVWVFKQIIQQDIIEKSMSLFVGNVSKKATQKQFEDEFRNYGKCKVDLRKGFAFVQYESQRNAEDAKRQLQYKNFCGLKFNIQWSKNSGRFNQNTKSHHKGRGRSFSRDRNGRDDRWGKRSPSYERRSSPQYSQPDLDNFVPKCPRDQILLNKLLAQRQQKRQAQLERQRQAQLNGQIINQNEGQQAKNVQQVNSNEKNNQQNQNKAEQIQGNGKNQEIQEQEDGKMQQE